MPTRKSGKNSLILCWKRWVVYLGLFTPVLTIVCLVSGIGDYENLCIAGQPVTDPGGLPWMLHQIVSPGYFRALRIPLLKGRFFDDRDQPSGENVVIINQSIAQRYF